MQMLMTEPTFSIVVAVIFVIVMAVLLYIGRVEQVKRAVLMMVLVAETKFGGGTGGLKYRYVVDAVYPKLPIIVKFFISEQRLGTIIEDAVARMKKMLSTE